MTIQDCHGSISIPNTRDKHCHVRRLISDWTMVIRIGWVKVECSGVREKSRPILVPPCTMATANFLLQLIALVVFPFYMYVNKESSHYGWLPPTA